MARRLGIYCGAHLVVDWACALLILGGATPGQDMGVYLVLYNFFAFAAQMPLGLLADRWGNNHKIAALGCWLVAVGWLMPLVVARVCLAGLGNALFHVGGGLDTINSGGEKVGPLGLFVSPGTLGIYWGAQWAGRISGLWVVLLLAALGASVLLWCRGPENQKASLPKITAPWIGALVCLVAVVVARSWLGLATLLPWKPQVGAWAVCAVAGGKALGGLLADRLGAFPVAGCSLAGAMACLLLPGPVAGLLGLCLFNMTMPLTLWGAARLLPGARGFAFGLLTFGLFLGFLPGGLGGSMVGQTVLAVGAGLSLLPLWFGLVTAKRQVNL